MTRDEREVNNVGDCRNKDICIFFKKPRGNMIRIGLFARTVREKPVDLRLRSRS